MACSFVMFRQVVAIALVALLVANAQAQSTCPSVFRVVNAIVPSTLSVDLLLNNNAVVTNVGYKNVSLYYQVQPGSVTVSVRATGTGTIIGTRTIQAAPGVAYTVAPTGPLNGDVDELLFGTTPFIFQENIIAPNPNTFKGYFHALSENDVQTTFTVLSTTGSFGSGIFDINPKIATAYPELPAGSYSFTVANNSLFAYVNSANQVIQLNRTLTSGQLFDVFWIGDDQNNEPSTLTVISSTTSYDTASGCNLVDGTTPYPNNSPVVIYSYGPNYCSASTIASGLAFLLALVALLL